MAQLAEQLSNDIRQALEADELDLPTLPEVALRIRDEAESENVSAPSLAKVIGEDPGLAAQVVKTANSPMFMAAVAIDDLAQAISRLGVQYAANLVTGLAMQQMFQATSELIDRKMRQIWKTSTDTAAWSSALAKRFTELRPDQAALAGLTHLMLGGEPLPLELAQEVRSLVRGRVTNMYGPTETTIWSTMAEIEDAAIRDLIAMQEAVGLKAVTDGEHVFAFFGWPRHYSEAFQRRPRPTRPWR